MDQDGVRKSGVLTALLALAIALALAVAVSACGGSSSTDSGTESSTAGGAESGTGGEASGGVDKELAALLPAEIREKGQISFGALWETPPIISVEPQDTSTPIGIAPDLAAAMTKLLGVEPVWRNMQWPAQLPGVESGNVDALFGQVSDSKEREEVVNIVGFYDSPIGILVASGNPSGIEGLSTACGLKIGVPAGSTMEEMVIANSKKMCTEKGKPAIGMAKFPNAQGAIVGVKSGTVDAWTDSDASVSDIAEKSGGTFESMPLPDPAVEEEPYVSPVTGIAVSKQQRGLAEALAGALRALSESGEYQKIMSKWGASGTEMPIEKITVNWFLEGSESGSSKNASAEG